MLKMPFIGYRCNYCAL